MDVFYVLKVFLVSCYVSSKGGKGLGKGGGKRHHKVLHDNIQGFTKAAVLVVSSSSPLTTLSVMPSPSPTMPLEDWDRYGCCLRPQEARTYPLYIFKG